MASHAEKKRQTEPHDHLSNLRRQLRDAVALRNKLAHEHDSACTLVARLELEILDADAPQVGAIHDR